VDATALQDRCLLKQDGVRTDCPWRGMIAALAGSQAPTLDALRRRGSIDQEDIDYILAVTEQGIAEAVGTPGPKSVVQMIRMCLQELSTSEAPRQGEPPSNPANRKTD
jgi:hypothetical protein